MKNIIKITLLLIILSLFAFGSYSDSTEIPVLTGDITEEEIPIIEEKQEVTNLDVILVDKINNSQFILKNCVLVLAGEMKVCEDSFSYKNSFVDGDILKITVVVELKEKEEK